MTILLFLIPFPGFIFYIVFGMWAIVSLNFLPSRMETENGATSVFPPYFLVDIMSDLGW